LVESIIYGPAKVSVHEFHHDRTLTATSTNTKYLHDVGMTEARQDVRFYQEASGVKVVEYLLRNFLAQLLRLSDGSIRPLAKNPELREDFPFYSGHQVDRRLLHVPRIGSYELEASGSITGTEFH
jgi:hypothetical protein